MDKLQGECTKESDAIHEFDGSQRPMEMSDRDSMHELAVQD